MRIRVNIEEAFIEYIVKRYGDILPFELKWFKIDEGDCINIKIDFGKFEAKAKLIPQVYNGKLSLYIDRVFGAGININIAKLIGQFTESFEKSLSDEMKKHIDVQGRHITFTDLPSNYAGISGDTIVFDITI